MASMQSKRIVVLDIETVSTDPNDPRGALGNGGEDAAPGERSQIVCCGALVEEGGELRPAMMADRDERALLRRFWSTVRADDLLVGHNLREFDIARIKQRSWILGVEPSFDPNLAKYRETQICDVMEMWTNWGSPKGAGLDNLARVLGVGRKSGSGAQIEEWWRAGEYGRLMDYCLNDVYLTYRIFCRMKFRRELPLQAPAAAPIAEPAAARSGERIEGFKTAPFRDPNVKPTPIAELFNRGPVPVREAEPVPAGRYRMVSDGHGGLRELPVVDARYPGAAASSDGASPARKSSAGAAAAPSFPSAAANAQTPADSPQSTPGPNSEQRPRGRDRRKRVYYVDTSGTLELTGGTFPIKEELKALGARVLTDQADKVIGWSIAAAKFDQLAGLCIRAGIALVPSSDERPGKGRTQGAAA